ncbi:YwbE family protein [Cytobacillus praedii]|uniref:YwbE family protein n=1 Tax=Cytobacillus praedii TaxID=1742358 RepID=A0A4R1AWG0_9BACI|nr:YwbE family protein [Cytobacillus praedii]MED3550756.1 YwbE family protein [Cytobacillus praedii]TCJ01896.1 YwbE family protein [Cytobacillus praedii]
MNGTNRKDISPGITVDIVLKADQRTGKLTRGVVKDILTNSGTHPHGIKVRLTDGQIGRVQFIHSN